MLTNATITDVLTRRSTRKFLGKKLPRECIDAILQGALYAPTGGNHQETRFIAITDAALLDKLEVLVKDKFASRPLDPTSYENKSAIAARKLGFCFSFHAPLLVVAVSPREHGNSMADSALGIGNMLVVANSLGIGSCYVNQVHWLTRDPDMRELLYNLGMKENEDCFASAVFGYPDGELNRGMPPRKEGRIILK